MLSKLTQTLHWNKLKKTCIPNSVHQIALWSKQSKDQKNKIYFQHSAKTLFKLDFFIWAEEETLTFDAATRIWRGRE